MSIDFVLAIVIDVGLMCWLGAQCWRSFVLPMVMNRGEVGVVKKVERRFERLFALPMLVILFVANGVIVFEQHLPFLWEWRLLILVLAMVNAGVPYVWRHRGQVVDEMLSLIDALLAVALLTIVVLSSPMAVRDASLPLYGVIDQWLILFALCLMVGSLLFLMIVVLPVLSVDGSKERVWVLVTILRCCSPLILSGSALFALALCGKLFLQVAEVGYFIETAYGRATIVAILLLIAFIFDWIWCRYGVKSSRLVEVVHDGGNGSRGEREETEEGEAEKQALERERRYGQVVAGGVNVGVLCGLGLLLCVGAMDMFAGSVVSLHQPVLRPPSAGAPSQPYRATVRTTDGQLTIKVLVTPNRFGVNTFVVTAAQQDGRLVTGAQVAIYTTMTEMDMGTDVVALKAVGAGQYSAQGDLSMSGRWRLRIVVRSGQNVAHEVSIVIDTPF